VRGPGFRKHGIYLLLKKLEAMPSRGGEVGVCRYEVADKRSVRGTLSFLRPHRKDRKPLEEEKLVKGQRGGKKNTGAEEFKKSRKTQKGGIEGGNERPKDGSLKNIRVIVNENLKMSGACLSRGKKEKLMGGSRRARTAHTI